jgi:ABC-2 type transport system permease protein
MIALLAAERMKLTSVRSPWWCAGLALALVVALTAVMAAAVAPARADVAGIEALSVSLAMTITMVAAVLAATTEYGFGTARTTLLAVPSRTAALLAKTAVVAGLAGLVGLVASVLGRLTAWVLRPGGIGLDTAGGWRALLAPALTFAIAAAAALAVGVLVRRTAAALGIVLGWKLAAGAVSIVGPTAAGWLPFRNVDNVVATDPGMPLGPWGSLVYVLAIAVGLVWAALLVSQSRDA